MKTTFLAAGAVLATASVPLAAQDAPRQRTATCFIEVRKLMAAPPAGIGELGSAIHDLDARLRPQVEEVIRLKELVAQLEARHQQPAQGEDGGADLIQLDEDLRKVRGELAARQAQLKLDYAAHKEAIVGPVQARIGERARSFAVRRGCGELRMARGPDLAGLASAGATDVTGDFIAWYALDKS